MAHYVKRAGICNVRVSAHTFRHTFARIWILNGGDAFTLRRILRHKTMDMVNRYIHLWGREVVLHPNTI
ncbi:site-specific integrase [Alicyclobacillaceae bacterium I2511]|nr:site-specific integrase [Alicyclobacillaceae bacterium I2511]